MITFTVGVSTALLEEIGRDTKDMENRLMFLWVLLFYLFNNFSFCVRFRGYMCRFVMWAYCCDVGVWGMNDLITEVVSILPNK